MEFFNNVSDIAELKKQYKQLALHLHPDCGGDETDFIKMNREYETLFKQIKAGIKEKTHSTKINLSDNDDGFREVINALMRLNVDIELCGEWLWIGGSTKECKDKLKEIGCKWATKKKLWYWKPAWQSLRGNRKEKTMEEIRLKYGSETIKSRALTA